MNAALELKKTLAGAIRQRMADERLSVTTFAQKTKTGRNAVRRILDPKNTAITLKTIGKTVDALDMEITLSVKQMPLPKLRKIAQQLAATADSGKAAKLKKKFMEGYYGQAITKAHAQAAAV